VNGHLFVTESGSPKGQPTISKQITDAIEAAMRLGLFRDILD